MPLPKKGQHKDSRRWRRRIVPILLILAAFAYPTFFFLQMNDPQVRPLTEPVRVPETSLPEHYAPLVSEDGEPIFDAIDTAGNRGYVADPTLLRRSVLSEAANASYWDRLDGYRGHLRKSNASLGSDVVCNQINMFPFDSGGFRVLAERITVDQVPTMRHEGGCDHNLNPAAKDNNNNTRADPWRVPKLFCAIYTVDASRDKARVAALSYGWKCDGFLAFSDVTIPSLGMVGLLHKGEESYGNMVQKVRSMWSYIAHHYIDDYDYFRIGGDDMHVIVENMRSLLLEMEPRTQDEPPKPLVFGQIARKANYEIMLAGGPGYTLNRIALKKLYDWMPNCATTIHEFREDYQMSRCFTKLRIPWEDSRDYCTGQQRHHNEYPAMLFKATSNARNARDYLKWQKRYWEGLPHPSIPNRTVGPTDGLESMSNHSVSFHMLRYPVWMAHHHATLYRACPAATPLGKRLGMTDGTSILEGGA